MGALRGKQAELKAVMDKLAALDADLQEKKNRKEKLESDVHMCRWGGKLRSPLRETHVISHLTEASKHLQCQAGPC